MSRSYIKAPPTLTHACWGHLLALWGIAREGEHPSTWSLTGKCQPWHWRGWGLKVQNLSELQRHHQPLRLSIQALPESALLTGPSEKKFFVKVTAGFPSCFLSLWIAQLRPGAADPEGRDGEGEGEPGEGSPVSQPLWFSHQLRWE